MNILINICSELKVWISQFDQTMKERDVFYETRLFLSETKSEYCEAEEPTKVDLTCVEYVWDKSSWKWFLNSDQSKWRCGCAAHCGSSVRRFAGNVRGAIKINFRKNLGFWPNKGGWGVWPKPKFLLKFSKVKFALVNVMKHTIHKWGSNTLSIHEGLGPPNSLSQPNNWNFPLENYL